MARKKFEIPAAFTSSIIRKVKGHFAETDAMKKNTTPVVLDFGPLQLVIPRFFGFCYGVENAIDIAYKTIKEHRGKRIFLLSEMIHNPTVNEDLLDKGVSFLFNTDGSERIPMEELTSEDIVIVPAFGTTLEIQKKLKEKGIDPYKYNTTCPFVEKVWKRGQQLGSKDYSLVIHGKHVHEETKATFSHSAEHSATVVVLNPEEAHILAGIITRKRPLSDFETYFGHKSTPGFDPLEDLRRFGVINQTTMLASETKEVMNILKKAVAEVVGEAMVLDHFADTSDTLCYATNENQSATIALSETGAHFALVVGGYNSSNTQHLVEILEHKMPTYHIRDASEIVSENLIKHFDQWKMQMHETKDWLPPEYKPIKIAITSGASCPDSLVDEVVLKLLSFFPDSKNPELVLPAFSQPR